MDKEQQITGIIHRALVSRGHQRIADLRKALSLAVEMSGAASGNPASYYMTKYRPQPG
jgi:hypothetical protein